MKTVLRVVAAVCCVALVGGAVWLGYEPQSVTFGAGDGENAEVTTLEDFYDVLRTAERGMAEDESLAPAGQPLQPAEQPAEEGAAEEHESLTLTQTTNIYIDEDSWISEEDVTSDTEVNVSMRRTLSIAITPEAMFYRSDGQLISRSYSLVRTTYRTQESGSYTVEREQERRIFYDFSMEIYITAAGSVYLKADRYEMTYYDYYRYENPRNTEDNTEREESDLPDEIDGIRNHIGEWIDCSSMPQLAEAFLQVNSVNMRTLSSFGDLIEEALAGGENNPFRRNGSRYEYDMQVMFDELFGETEEYDFDGELYLDVSAPEKPMFVYELDGTYRDRYAYEREEFLFENIDNTVIRPLEEIVGTDAREIFPEEA